ncbi:AsmA-like C-terminal region-containing protein [Chitinophagaceae bacterium 26-R-25]|nr:AsmA-like C-terminal region-containing protein [Chitinophagaceae bacterium 26-R-25]
MKFSVFPFLKKLLKVSGISIAALLLLLFFAPYLLPNTVATHIKSWTNKSIDGELEFSKARLSFFNHFPSLTLTLHDFCLKGSAPYKKDTLIAANEVALGINLTTLLYSKKVVIDEIYVDNGNIKILSDEKGHANYNVYISTPDSTKKKDASDTSSANLELSKIVINNSHVLYDDKSVPLHIDAFGFNYKGTGDFSESIFDLTTKARIDSIDFSFSNIYYLQRKNVKANLVTKINTKSLAFIFTKNRLKINGLPITFNGTLDFLENGYAMDLSVSSKKAGLYDLFTAMPPQYVEWLKKTDVDGFANLLLTLKGKYIASKNLSPDLNFHMDVDRGFVRYNNAPVPAKNIALRLDVKMPSLNVDSMQINADSISFNLEKDYLKGTIRTKGFSQPYVFANIDANMNLEMLQRAFGFTNYDTKGKLDLQLHADGNYTTDTVVKRTLRKTIIDTVVTCIPAFTIKSSMSNGYFKYASLPEAIKNINFKLDASCDSNYRHMKLDIANLNAVALNSFVKGNINLSGLPDVFVNANIQSTLNMQEIEKVYPLESMQLKGALQLNVNSKGTYDADKKKFPVTTADIRLADGVLKTKYYPNAIESININAKANDNDGTLKDLNVYVEPASFVFEGKPFYVKGSLMNFEDILYDITAKGELDIDKIYKVFSQKEFNVTGLIKADFALKGRQSDAMNGRYAKLNNSGTLEVKELAIAHEAFPQPFKITEGLFRFNQDKMWFNKFIAQYGNSDFRLDGYCSNVLNYIMNDKAVIQGDFKLDSKFIDVNEFMAFAPAPDKKLPEEAKAFPAETPTASGVVIIPENLNLHLSANAAKIKYNDIVLENFTGDATLNNSQLTLKQAAFNMIGCNVAMDAVYASVNPVKANFNYHITATDFDVKRAYNEIKIFHDLATAASKAEGIVSIDYKLNGKLNENMMPIYPSLVGGGTLSVKKVKLKGLKLFNAVGSKTGKDDIKDPDLSKVDFKTTIKNNLITLERTKMKVSGFRIRIEGQTSFDQRLNLKMRLGLPPLGIIGIPIKVTGTAENPNIAVGKNTDQLEETEYED